ncbi:hypothetical protein Q2T52_13360 [Rhizobium oryzicola]|uniref:Tetratricopeptide repeat protein n=2 Tax=Rhizobium oryzicola TaxID=1232668 RepID=A0ABT8SYW1_9HYPH|nr:hypothetical protein [Rhizobium oryzicola]
MEEELPDDIYDRVSDLSERGNDLLEAGQADAAIVAWQSALALLPEPRRKWEAAMWLHASIGDAQQQQGETEAALLSFQEAAESADGYANGFVQLGIGTCLFDLGRKAESTDHLLRAFMAEGEEIFEESDPKYFDHLRSQKLID